MKKSQNVVGPQVRKIRIGLGWSQDQLATRLNLGGWDISRATLSKIEAQLRCVTDWELLHLAGALKSTLDCLYSPQAARGRLKRQG
jgi:transcriptional regulator with XRE-family HTH domain